MKLMTQEYAFIGGTRSITVSANNETEKSKWMQDITEAVQNAKEHGNSKANYLSLKSCSKYTVLFIICFCYCLNSNVY